MQCQKINLDHKIQSERLKDIFQLYIDRCIEISKLYPNDVCRVMTNYPAGLGHYTMNKRLDENWEIIETDDYFLCTMITKFDTRMVSVYYKQSAEIDDYVKQIISKIESAENITNKTAVVALVYAGPKFRLEKHIDSKGLVRYHIPVVVNSNSYFETFDPYQKYYPQPGELWRLETHLPHAAQNDDEENYRIHCIVDFV